MIKTIILSIIVGAVYSKVIMMNRHAQRSPTEYTELDSQRWGPYQPGDLTQYGIQTLIKKGSKLRITGEFAIYDRQGYCLLDKIDVLSSAKQRTILSTYSFLKGLCPFNYKQVFDHFTGEYLTRYATDFDDLQALVESDGEDLYLLSNKTRTFKIKPDFIFHGHSKSNCRIQEEALKIQIQSDFYQQSVAYFKSHPDYERILQMIKEQDITESTLNPEKFTVENYPIKKFKTFYGNYKCNRAEGLQVPLLSQEQHRLLHDISVFMFYDIQNGNEIQNKGSLTEIFRWIVASIENKDKKLHIYSGHDSNQVAVLAVLLDREQRNKLRHAILPTFASDLKFKLLGDEIQVYLNGSILKTRMCDDGYTCQVTEAVKFMKEYIVEDIETYCK